MIFFGLLVALKHAVETFKQAKTVNMHRPTTTHIARPYRFEKLPKGDFALLAALSDFDEGV